MKIKMVNIFAAFVAAAALSVPALAQDAKSLDELLQMIESSSISESADSSNAHGRSSTRAFGSRLWRVT